MENFKKESQSARIRRQEAVKLRDMKCLAFGKFITLVPAHNLSRHYDRPHARSFAKLHTDENDIKMAPQGILWQQLFGVFLPRTERDTRTRARNARAPEALGPPRITCSVTRNTRTMQRLTKVCASTSTRTPNRAWLFLSDLRCRFCLYEMILQKKAKHSSTVKQT